MSETELDVLRDIRELLLVVVEPQLKDKLRKIAGRGEKKIAAILLMDGNRTRADILKESEIDNGDLSKLIKALDVAKLLKSNNGANHQLVFPVSRSFFSEDRDNG